LGGFFRFNIERQLIKMKLKESLKKILMKINKVASEDMSQYDPNADYDTRVKLPEWQLKKLKQSKQAKKDL
tara:strand:+ start:282 stop:494 length:213 start_codon:yes stop_codon:yes gene_type:complete